MARSGAAHYFHKDHLGSPRAITDAAGALAGKHDYYPFGQETPNNPLAPRSDGEIHRPSAGPARSQRLHAGPHLPLPSTPLRQRRPGSGWVESLRLYREQPDQICGSRMDGRLSSRPPRSTTSRISWCVTPSGSWCEILEGATEWLAWPIAVASLFFPTSLEEFVSNQDPSDFINPIAVATAPIKKVGVAIAKRGCTEAWSQGEYKRSQHQVEGNLRSRLDAFEPLVATGGRAEFLKHVM